MMRFALLVVALCVGPAAMADQVTISGGDVYVTRNDCRTLVQHRPAPDVAYQPGTDVHGKYVAPADLPGSGYAAGLPDKVQFNVVVNPLAYGQTQGASGKYANTTLPVAHVEVDLKTGEASLNGKPLTGVQDRALLDACRKEGLR
jgi:hypothetical protein